MKSGRPRYASGRSSGAKLGRIKKIGADIQCPLFLFWITKSALPGKPSPDQVRQPRGFGALFVGLHQFAERFNQTGQRVRLVRAAGVEQLVQIFDSRVVLRFLRDVFFVIAESV
jgi:hypothetical protein